MPVYPGAPRQNRTRLRARVPCRIVSRAASLETITSEDREEVLKQIEAEQDAYEAIKELHDRIIRLLREDNQAVKTIKRRLRLTIVDRGKLAWTPHDSTHTTIVG